MHAFEYVHIGMCENLDMCVQVLRSVPNIQGMASKPPRENKGNLILFLVESLLNVACMAQRLSCWFVGR